MPIFSVIVPVYNIEKYVSECIKSVLDQTFSDYELILVDDGSTDNSGFICEQFRDNRIRVIHKENGGNGSARKAGVNIACGEYAVCIDGDDWVAPEYLNDFYKVIQKCHPDVIVSRMNLVYENKFFKQILPYPNGYYDRTEIENSIFPSLICGEKGEHFKYGVAGKCFVMNRYRLIQMGVDDRFTMGEDMLVTVPYIYRSHSLFILDGYNYYYRKHGLSMTGKKDRILSLEHPMDRAKYLSNNIDIKIGSFQEQLYRMTVHALFNAVTSQFNRQDTEDIIRKDIIDAVMRPYYQEAIKSKYTGNWKEIAAKIALKYRCLSVMKLFNYLRINWNKIAGK